MKRTARIAVLVLVVTVAAVVILGCGKPKPKDVVTEAAVPVALAEVTLGSMSETVPVTGTLKADREAAVKPQVSAQVTAVLAQEGDAVSQGQVLITLDQTDYQNQVRQASAAVATAQASVGAARAQWQASVRRLQVVVEGARPEERAIARSKLEQAEAALRQAQADLQRRQKLFDAGAISKEAQEAAQTAFDTARTIRDAAAQSVQLLEKGARPEEVEAARSEAEAAHKQMESAQENVNLASATLARARELLSYTTIRSPISGVVYERSIEPGEIVSTGNDPLLRIADLNSVYYEATVPGRLAPQVQAGQPVTVSVRGDGSRTTQGTVHKLVPVANPMSRDFVAIVRVSKAQGLARPGLYAEGQIVTKRREAVPLIPKDALLERNGRTVVYVVASDQAKERSVKVGLTDASRAEVLSGLSPGEKIVVEGASTLSDGAKVAVQPAAGE
jgi:HlyD family secretion protein